jgi:3-deoxy-7-phosphoheptulonate synthase
MILVMKPDATQEQINQTVAQIEQWGHMTNIAKGESQAVIGIIGDKSDILDKPLSTLPGVKKVLEVSSPYKRVSREFHPEDTIVDVNGVKIGGGHKCVIAGPCSVDTEEYLMEIANRVKAAGATMLRGGAFKPRTSPYAFQGHGEDGLKMLAAAREETGLPIVSELMSLDQIDIMYKYADVIQIGARNMQNFNLLREIGTLGKPVILKNGIASQAKEHLMSAEYLMAGGLNDVILCLRGVRTYEGAFRNSLDVALVPYLQEKSHLPVIVDSSHSVGIRQYVMPVAHAGMAIGADGLILEVHPNPSCALSDGDQALLPDDFDYLMKGLKNMIPWDQKTWAANAK